MKANNEIKGYCIFQPEYGEPVILAGCVCLGDGTIMGSLIGKAGIKIYNQRYMIAKATSPTIARSFVQKQMELV